MSLPYCVENKPKIIINADDFGITQGVNKAIFELVDAGVLTSTTVMANMPYYREILKIGNRIGIGVHLNLTTGRPVMGPDKVQTLVGKDGNFFKLSELIKRMRKGRVSKQDVKVELNAQVRRLSEDGIHIDHIDSHESLIKYPFFVSIIKEVAKQHGIMAVRTYTPRKFDYKRLLNPKRILISAYLAFQKMQWRWAGFNVVDKYDALIKMGLDEKTAIQKLKDIIQNAPDGVLELCVHPGYCNGDNAPLGRYVYERENELRALMSQEVKETVGTSGIELISFRDLNR